MNAFLRYRPGTPLGDRFPTIRYPSKGCWPRETAELVRSQMAGCAQIEIVEDPKETA